MNAQNNRDSLNAQQQGLITIAALTATGDQENLKVQFYSALDAGLCINAIKEALTQLYAYCGFPRSLNAISTFKAVLDKRKAKGIPDSIGKEIVVENAVADKYEQGRKVLEALTKTPQAKPAPGFGEFAPRIDAFLKEHLFADIFASDVLSFQQRELVTIAALAAMPGVEPQLKAHISMGRNCGITEDQLTQVAELIEKNVTKTQANVLRTLLSKSPAPVTEPEMMVRISEIEVVPEHLEAYKNILKEEAATSIQIEPGVIAIFPMYQQDSPTQVRIIEIYANREAYQSHLQTPHFLHYKTATLKMVKSLKLTDMNGIDKETMPQLFKKLK
ncbi:carboxymuconolactone decarboxylase family protein [Niabella sp.]|uniref:carboxymuconolactone decarboxylase family protein n=1 Tax=Niabella sp. TaxID=1962976 RepID=UPI0026187365|nr:carboxymuconolactone decarboxylase family protein [Niabella sp.]